MVITIAGGYGCGGKHIAKLAAEKLGYRFCDDEIVSEAVRDAFPASGDTGNSSDLQEIAKEKKSKATNKPLIIIHLNLKDNK